MIFFTSLILIQSKCLKIIMENTMKIEKNTDNFNALHISSGLQDIPLDNDVLL